MVPPSLAHVNLIFHVFLEFQYTLGVRGTVPLQWGFVKGRGCLNECRFSLTTQAGLGLLLSKNSAGAFSVLLEPICPIVSNGFSILFRKHGVFFAVDCLVIEEARNVHTCVKCLDTVVAVFVTKPTNFQGFAAMFLNSICQRAAGLYVLQPTHRRDGRWRVVGKVRNVDFALQFFPFEDDEAR